MFYALNSNGDLKLGSFTGVGNYAIAMSETRNGIEMSQGNGFWYNRIVESDAVLEIDEELTEVLRYKKNDSPDPYFAVKPGYVWAADDNQFYYAGNADPLELTIDEKNVLMDLLAPQISPLFAATLATLLHPPTEAVIGRLREMLIELSKPAKATSK
jgi:hypothetical protein